MRSEPTYFSVRTTRILDLFEIFVIDDRLPSALNTRVIERRVLARSTKFRKEKYFFSANGIYVDKIIFRLAYKN